MVKTSFERGFGQVRTPWRQGTKGLSEWGVSEESLFIREMNCPPECDQIRNRFGFFVQFFLQGKQLLLSLACTFFYPVCFPLAWSWLVVITLILLSVVDPLLPLVLSGDPTPRQTALAKYVRTLPRRRRPYTSGTISPLMRGTHRALDPDHSLRTQVRYFPPFVRRAIIIHIQIVVRSSCRVPRASSLKTQNISC